MKQQSQRLRKNKLRIPYICVALHINICGGNLNAQSACFFLRKQLNKILMNNYSITCNYSFFLFLRHKYDLREGICLNIIITAYGYIAALVGAGFASGQEILSFFVVYGRWGLLGIALSSAIFGYYAYFILYSCTLYKVSDYNSLLEKSFDKGLARVANAVTFVFTCVVYSVMVACAGESAYLLWGVNPVVGSVGLSALCFAVLMTGKNGALEINGVLGIIIAVGMTAAAIYMLRYREHQTFLNGIRAIGSGAGYSGYNLLGSGVVLAGMSPYIKTRRSAAAVGIISACVIFVMMSLVWALLSLYYRYINLGEIPMLTMALRQNRTVALIYSVVLMLAVLTTAISSAFGILDTVGERVERVKIIILIALGGICISRVGFSSLINVVYRICGYLGIVLIIYMFFSLNYKKRQNRVKIKDKSSFSEKNIKK